ncbi:hypothetical protein [Pseudoxanthomonas wuyuanensis]|uniref:Uncharacterized protein n=1 Tax=Pseudoxanthomonas wuyuanensis TaxID=1073196 RepID=A0A286DFR2_9GAMM|nr:hypothetical protein [Pseudoxanthomonas wuyuanensis]KAF1719592.1 hypothetical protein CSC75_14790 [Pseudoxanthomonas wuyuanensis]SOD57410.1 hypothetical protein SAMN06296416_11347 [Pseudoxanthomonas wuyuanensis]
MPTFYKPFEVTQFWALDRYTIHEARSSQFTALLTVETDQPDQWFFSVTLTGTDLSLGNYVPPFLPTRENIAAINGATDELFGFIDILHRTGKKQLPERDALKLIAASPTAVSRNMRDYAYRTALFKVLAEDWGIDLPLPNQFGKEVISLSMRPGLPCGPAMISAVEPVLAAAWGPVKKGRVVTINREGRMIDQVSYAAANGEELVQEFDVTDFYGKNLPMTDFDFSSTRPNAPAPAKFAAGSQQTAAAPKVNSGVDHEQLKNMLDEYQDEAVDFLLYLSDLYMIVKRGLLQGHPPRILSGTAYQAITKERSPDTWLLTAPSLRDLSFAVLKHKLGRPPKGYELDSAMELARLQFGLVDTNGNIAIYKKAWWKFWSR